MIVQHGIIYDVILVDSGFGGYFLPNELRNQGFKTVVLEEASDLGGTWHWNSYNGARADSKVPPYEFTNEDIWINWTWTEKYPGSAEIQKCFDFVDSKLQLRRDIKFNSRVSSAHFGEEKNVWHAATDSKSFETRYFVFRTGFVSKPLILWSGATELVSEQVAFPSTDREDSIFDITEGIATESNTLCGKEPQYAVDPLSCFLPRIDLWCERHFDCYIVLVWLPEYNVLPPFCVSTVSFLLLSETAT